MRTEVRESAGAPRSFQPWRPVDEMVLRALVHSRVAEDEIARRLGRTVAEVRIHLERLGLL
ncbi:MAG TPA: hypothetical protein ENK55_07710 [Actinobacteria bacterium]|nr:hypothetical protein [Actinomycetota bacterium]